MNKLTSMLIWMISQVLKFAGLGAALGLILPVKCVLLCTRCGKGQTNNQLVSPDHTVYVCECHLNHAECWLGRRVDSHGWKWQAHLLCLYTWACTTLLHLSIHPLMLLLIHPSIHLKHDFHAFASVCKQFQSYREDKTHSFNKMFFTRVLGKHRSNILCNMI